MHRSYTILLTLLLLCLGCSWHLRPNDDEAAEQRAAIERYDQTERLFLTTGDFAALQQLKTSYPMQTRTLIEDVIGLGLVSDADINSRFFSFFQDSTLQVLLADVDRQYADLSDIEHQLAQALSRLQQLKPGLELPRIYTQVGSLDQSIVVADGLLGICLDKYLGEDYPLYLRFDYTEQQRRTMTRQFIVPDCLSFYLLSLYPLSDFEHASEAERHWHIAKVQHAVNLAMASTAFDDSVVSRVARKLSGQPASLDAIMALPL